MSDVLGTSNLSVQLPQEFLFQDKSGHPECKFSKTPVSAGTPVFKVCLQFQAHCTFSGTGLSFSLTVPEK